MNTFAALKSWIRFLLVCASPCLAQTSAPQGRLDIRFNGIGYTSIAVGAGNTYGRTLAGQGNGKILVGGYAHNGVNFDFTVCRFMADGTRDRGFGNDGEVITPVGAGDDYGLCLATQSDGKIVLAGYSESLGVREIAIVRYGIDGALDLGFGTSGKQLIQVGQSRSSAWSLAIQADGKILLAGWADNAGRDVFASIRLNANGTLDPTFGDGGKVMTAVGGGSSSGRGIAIQNDGKILIGGFATVGGSPDFAVVRYNSAGELDTSFGTGGVAVIPVGASTTDYGYSTIVQADQKIVIAGSSSENGNSDFAMVRLDQTGNLDQGFGVGGVVTLDFESGNDSALKVTVQPDGKLVLVGSARVQGVGNIAVARYNPDGTPDVSFGNSGKVTTAVSNSLNASWDVVIAPNGRISVAGWSQIESRFQLTLVRYIGTKAIEDWRFQYFGTTLNLGIASNGSDPDTDGACNLVEYAFGTSPDKPGGLALPLPRTEAETYLIEFTSPEGVSGIHYGIEWSSSLTSGGWQELENQAVPPNYFFAPSLVPVTKAFFRYRISEQP